MYRYPTAPDELAKNYPTHADPDTRANLLLSAIVSHDNLLRQDIGNLYGATALRTSYGLTGKELTATKTDSDYTINLKADSLLTSVGAINEKIELTATVPADSNIRLLLLTGAIYSEKKESDFPSIEGINIKMYNSSRKHVLQLRAVDISEVIKSTQGVNIKPLYSNDNSVYTIYEDGYGAREIEEMKSITPSENSEFETGTEFSVFLGQITTGIIESGIWPRKTWENISAPSQETGGVKTIEVAHPSDLLNLNTDQVNIYDQVYVASERVIYTVTDATALGTANAFQRTGGALTTDDVEATALNQYMSPTQATRLIEAFTKANRALPRTGGTMTGYITTHADPTEDLHVANKRYVDSLVQGLDTKQSCRLATTTNIQRSGLFEIDGITPEAGDRILVKDQTTPAQNGIYVAGTGAWTRATDADTSAKITPGMFTFIEEGITNGNNGFTLVTDGPITIDTTALTFTQFSGAGQITPGVGLKKTGNTLYLANTGVTSGTYTKVTVDNQGRVTTAKTLSESDIPSLAWSKITSGKPTTLSGYGITDAVNTSEVVTTATANKILKLNSSGNLPASITGNAATATALKTARTFSISGDVAATAVSFNGTANIVLSATLASTGVIAGSAGATGNFSPGYSGTFHVPQITVDAKGRVTALQDRIITMPSTQTSITGNAATATKWATTRTITLSGVTATAQSINGTANVTIPVTAVPASLLTGTISTDRIPALQYLSLAGGNLSGDLRIKNATNFGCKLNFGDGDYVHLYEYEDDKLEIKAKAINLVYTDTTQTKVTVDSSSVGRVRNIEVSSSAPTGGKNNDIWIQYST